MKNQILLRKKLQVACVLPALLAVALGLAGCRGRPLRIFFMDVGQGDASFIMFPCGKNMLVDGGDARQQNTDIIRFLRGLRVRGIDVLVLSHAHSDHLGGLLRVLEVFPVALVIEPGYPHTTDIYMNFLKAVESGDIPYRTAVRGDAIEGYKNTSIKVLNPPRTFYAGASAINNNSAALLIRHKKNVFLFTGDIEEKAERELAEVFGHALRSDVLKVPHHGSRTSSTAEFLEAVAPQIAVIQAGSGNPYGHPHEEVIKRYESAGSRIFRTDLHGMITVSSDGRRVGVKKSAD